LIATLPLGYADGYKRLLSNRGEVLINGRRAPVTGRVCMDLTMVDVTDIANVQPGDEVVLLGRQAAAEITADQLAAWTDTISYEIFTSISARVPRIHQF
jgi:alanine racemase